MTRPEEDLRPETLQMRSDAIISGLRKAFEHGLEPKHLAVLHAYCQREHQDMLLVYLGLKPGAVFLNNVFRIYRPTEEVDHLTLLPSGKDSGVKVKYNPASQSVWNPVQTRRLMIAYPDLASAATWEARKNPDLLEPDNLEFGNFIHDISSIRTRQSTEMRVLSGIMNGYPREAAEFFCQNQDVLINSIADILREAERRKIAYYMEDDSISVGTIGASERTRSELLRLATMIGFGDEHVLNLISKTRLADVPGYQYITMEGLTTEHEERVRKAYDDSKMEEKLAELLPVF